MTELLLVALLLTPLITAALCWSMRQTTRPPLVSSLGSLVTLGLGLGLSGLVFGEGAQSTWSGFVWFDALSGLMLVIVCLVSAGASLHAVGYLAHEVSAGRVPSQQLSWYYIWFHLFVFTMLGVCLVNNLGVMWVFIEATTIVSALLVGFYQSEAALEAAWKYIIICTVGITLALFGLILLYYSAAQVLGPSEAALDWTALRGVASRLDPALLKLAFIFVVVGYGTKTGFAPLHTWLPDANSQAPAPVSAVLSGVLHSCALYGILRVYLVVSPGAGSEFTGGLLILLGLFSLLIAVPFVLVQRDLTRLLSYSSIEHIGLVAVAVGLGGRLALYGGMLHLLNHAITKAFLFLAAGTITQRYGTRQMVRIRGLLQTMPLTGPLFLIGGLAIIGAPPFSLFVSEFSIISGAFGQGRWWVGALMLLGLGLIFAGMFYHISTMVLGAAPERVKRGETGWQGWVLLGVPALVTLVLGLVVPAPLSEALGQVVAILSER